MLHLYFSTVFVSGSLLWGVIGFTCGNSNLDVFCFWISGVSGFSSCFVVWESSSTSFFDSSSVLASFRVSLVDLDVSSISASISIRSRKLTFGSVLGSACGMVASSGMISGVDLKVEIGFLTYGCVLIGLSINLLLYAVFPLFPVLLSIGCISSGFSSILGILPPCSFLQFIWCWTVEKC